MTPINFENSRSNIKVTVAFYAKKNISAQYIENLLSDSHGSNVLGRKIGHTQ